MSSITAHQIENILPTKAAIEDKLLSFPSVTGVDVALKVTNGVTTDTPCILVFVREKGVFEPEHEIPKTIEGIATDVRQAVFRRRAGNVDELSSRVDANRYTPCQPGAAIAPARFRDWWGTLGLLVFDYISKKESWLSAYHVLCDDSNWDKPDVDRRILQPPAHFGGIESFDTIGSVTRGKFGKFDTGTTGFAYVDCALCSIDGRSTSNEIIDIGKPKGSAPASINEVVQKYGATTQNTFGVVTSTNLTMKFEVPGGPVIFARQIRVSPYPGGDSIFSQPGDSGAAVVNTDGMVIGMIIASTDDSEETCVNPMWQIIEVLQVTVVT